MAAILTDAADPAQRCSVLIQRHQADAALAEGLSHLTQRRIQVRQILWPAGGEALNEQRRHLLDSRLIAGPQVCDAHSLVPHDRSSRSLTARQTCSASAPGAAVASKTTQREGSSRARVR